MVIRLLTGKDVAGSVRYNENKVGEGQARCILIANYPDPVIAEKSARFRLQLLQQQARLNPTISRPAVHVAVAFHPAEVLSDDRLQQIAGAVMSQAGYANQPYLVYRHNDTKHPHIHIVSVAVDPNGRKISDQFIKRRLNTIRQTLEQQYDLRPADGLNHRRSGEIDGPAGAERVSVYQLLNEVIERQLTTYSFGSVASFSQHLDRQGVRMNTSAGRSRAGVTYQLMTATASRPVPASRLACQPTHHRLRERFAALQDRHKHGRDSLVGMVTNRISQYETLTKVGFTDELRRAGIQVHEQDGAYLYTHERAGLVVSEIEMPPALQRHALQGWFADQTVRRQRPQAITGNGDLRQLSGVPAPLADSPASQQPDTTQPDTTLPKSTVPKSTVRNSVGSLAAATGPLATAKPAAPDNAEVQTPPPAVAVSAAEIIGKTIPLPEKKISRQKKNRQKNRPRV